MGLSLQGLGLSQSQSVSVSFSLLSPSLVLAMYNLFYKGSKSFLPQTFFGSPGYLLGILCLLYHSWPHLITSVPSPLSKGHNMLSPYPWVVPYVISPYLSRFKRKLLISQAKVLLCSAPTWGQTVPPLEQDYMEPKGTVGDVSPFHYHFHLREATLSSVSYFDFDEEVERRHETPIIPKPSTPKRTSSPLPSDNNLLLSSIFHCTKRNPMTIH